MATRWARALKEPFEHRPVLVRHFHTHSVSEREEYMVRKTFTEPPPLLAGYRRP